MSAKHAEFDRTLACECAKAFAGSTGLGCAVTGPDGEVYDSFGYSCAGCNMCRLANLPDNRCSETHLYGLREAERFGGKYIYFCAMGLTCFVSPIVGHNEAVAKVTVGPFLMVDAEDYVAYELQELRKLSDEQIEPLRRELDRIPVIEPASVNALSTLLFMSIGFMNNVAAANDMMHTQRSEYLQSQISSYISELKRDGQSPSYPFRQEQILVQYMLQSERDKAQHVLNEILGHILFSSGGNFRWIRTRCYELLVTISRTAVKNGADPEYILRLSDEYFETIPNCRNIEDLSMHLSDALRRFMDSNFDLPDAKHSDAIHNAIYFIQQNYSQKITLEDAARYVYLSPTYLSRVFKQEAGTSFTRFLNGVRVEKSRKLLSMTDMKLAEIAVACGFEDQSYFTKVFRSITGETPQQYRKSKSPTPYIDTSGGIHS